MKTTPYLILSLLVISLISLMINACSTPPIKPPPPTPQAITISFTPALRPLLDAINTCAVQQPEIALVINEFTAPHLVIQDSGLALRLGYPEESRAFSALLAEEEIVFIVHPTNPVDSLGVGEVVDLFRGRTTNWLDFNGHNVAVEVWINLPEDDLHQIIQSRLLNGRPASTLANLAPDPEAMLTSVKSNPAAIGYLPRSWLSPEVKTIRIIPDISEVLTPPVLALSPKEPQEEIRIFLFCLQNGIGQEKIQELYQWENIIGSDLAD